MRIICFAWTTAALVVGAKTCTRRKWPPNWARQFHKGDLVVAYDRSPRYGGKQVAMIRLTQDPYRENTADAPDADYEAEGLAWMEREMLPIFQNKRRFTFANDFWDAWKNEAEDVWVVRFELVKETLQ